VRGAAALVTTPQPQNTFRVSFAAAVASGIDTGSWTLLQTGTNQTIAQSGGNLVVTAGTTANAETIIRSNASFASPLIARVQTILSQRIANNNFVVELVDVIGDNLSLTVNSATSVTVTIPNNPFTSANVGQSLLIGAVQNVSASAIPGRYAIASVSGNDVTFTVASWPASGSGTCSLMGWNFHQLVYSGTTATNASYDTQRRGYNSGYTTATISTTASAGHVATMVGTDSNAYLADQTAASATAVQLTQRASRVVNLPHEEANLYLQLRVLNGSAAPASSTTWTVGMAAVENYTATHVVVNEIKPQGLANSMPITGAVTVSSGTVTTVTTVTTVSAVTAANLSIPGTIADVASAALTSTATTATLTPTFGAAYSVSIPVTAVSGSSPTLDVSIEESADSGTNWFKVYDFPRITTTGFYRSPVLPLRGNRVRYVQTVGGSTPSFTRSINRLQSSWAGARPICQSYERALDLTTLNAATSGLVADEVTVAYLEVAVGAITTTAPQLQLQGSSDGSNWILLGSPLTAVADSVVSTKVLDVSYKFLRAIVTTAGVGVTSNYVLVKGYST
jgi:hypothetical protein